MDIYKLLRQVPSFSNARHFSFGAPDELKTFRTAENYFAVVTAARHNVHGASVIGPHDYVHARDRYLRALSTAGKTAASGIDAKSPDQMLVDCHHGVVAALVAAKPALVA